MSKPKTTTVSFEVTLPPDGWEASSRQPNIGELCMAWEGDDGWAIPTIATRGNLASPDCLPSVFAYPQIDKWNQQLEALKLGDGWVAVDKNKEACWYKKKPRLQDFSWFNNDGCWCISDLTDMLGFPITQYEGDWKKSLRQIKNHKVVTP